MHGHVSSHSRLHLMVGAQPRRLGQLAARHEHSMDDRCSDVGNANAPRLALWQEGLNRLRPSVGHGARPPLGARQNWRWVAWANAAESGCRMPNGCYARRLPVQAQPRNSTGKRRSIRLFHPLSLQRDACPCHPTQARLNCPAPPSASHALIPLRIMPLRSPSPARPV